MARALVAKAVYDMPTTRVLLDRYESVFSRAFAEFSHTQFAPARARSADLEHPPRPVGGPPLPRLDGHRGPRDAGREAEGTSAAQAQTGTAEEG